MFNVKQLFGFFASCLAQRFVCPLWEWLLYGMPIHLVLEAFQETPNKESRFRNFAKIKFSGIYEMGGNVTKNVKRNTCYNYIFYD